MKIRFILIPLFVSAIFAGDLIPTNYSLSESMPHSSRVIGLTSNIVSEIKLQGDSLVWLGTSSSIARMEDSATVVTLDTLRLSDGTDQLMEYGISAIAVSGDSVLFASATRDKDVSVGAGLYYATNGSDSLPIWTYYPQPVEQIGDSLVPFANKYFRANPITTDHKNVTYDASIGGGYLWIASWAGGLRRFDLANGHSFDRVPLPMDAQDTLLTCSDSSYVTNNDGQDVLKNYYQNPQDPSDGGTGNHNHKAFSVLAYSDTVWVGTADGINRGILGLNGCIDWTHFRFPYDGMSGNWVVSITRQDKAGKHLIWAVTLSTDLEGEQRGVSYTDDDGETWHSVLLNERGYNVISQDSLVLVSTDNGLWRSDDGTNWALYKPAHQAIPMQADEILSNTVYAAVPDARSYFPNPILWIGTPDGLAKSSDLSGQNWTIFRTNYDPQTAYAYPNPFSPMSHNQVDGDGYVRIHVDVHTSYVVDMSVYNFAMENVFRQSYDRRTANGTLKWNGRDSNGRLVANGVYFIKLDYDAKTDWLKLIVVK